MFYIGGRGFVCQIIEPVTFARLYLHCGISHWADIKIHVETFRTFTARRTDGLKCINRKSVPLNRPESSLRSQLTLGAHVQQMLLWYSVCVSVCL